MIPKTKFRGYWPERAACKGIDMMLKNYTRPQTWILTRPDNINRLHLCTQCEVLEQCTDWVMGEEIDPCPFHIVAGMVPTERGRIRKQMRRARP